MKIQYVKVICVKTYEVFMVCRNTKNPSNLYVTQLFCIKIFLNINSDELEFTLS